MQHSEASAATCAPNRCEPRRRVPTQPIGPSKESLPLPSSANYTSRTAKTAKYMFNPGTDPRVPVLLQTEAKINGSGGIRTHASEETGALNQRLRPLGHATRCSLTASKAIISNTSNGNDWTCITC